MEKKIQIYWRIVYFKNFKTFTCFYVLFFNVFIPQSEFESVLHGMDHLSYLTKTNNF